MSFLFYIQKPGSREWDYLVLGSILYLILKYFHIFITFFPSINSSLDTIGTVLWEYTPDKSVPSGAWTTIMTLSVPAGTWVLCSNCTFHIDPAQSETTGVATIRHTTGTTRQSTPLIKGLYTSAGLTDIVTLTKTTIITIDCYSSIPCVTGGPLINCIRIK